MRENLFQKINTIIGLLIFRIIWFLKIPQGFGLLILFFLYFFLPSPGEVFGCS